MIPPNSFYKNNKHWHVRTNTSTYFFCWYLRSLLLQDPFSIISTLLYSWIVVCYRAKKWESLYFFNVWPSMSAPGTQKKEPPSKVEFIQISRLQKFRHFFLNGCKNSDSQIRTIMVMPNKGSILFVECPPVFLPTLWI